MPGSALKSRPVEKLKGSLPMGVMGSISIAGSFPATGLGRRSGGMAVGSATTIRFST